MIKNLKWAITFMMIMTSSLMAQPAIQLESIQDIESEYDIFVIDMVGVVYNEAEALPGAINTLDRLSDKNKKLILLSNNPRPNHIAKKKLVSLGFSESLKIVTSGDLTRDYINKNFIKKKIYHLGSLRNQDLLKDLDIKIVDSIEQADLIVISLFIEEDDDPKLYEKEITEIANSHLPVVCANPDIYAAYGDTVRKTAGYFCREIQNLGKEVLYLGKPNIMAYEFLWDHLGLSEQHKSKSIMVGDTLETDIIGAKNFGISSLLVLTGNTGRDINSSSINAEDYLKNLNQDIRPAYYSKGFY